MSPVKSSRELKRCHLGRLGKGALKGRYKITIASICSELQQVSEKRALKGRHKIARGKAQRSPGDEGLSNNRER